MTLHPDKLPLLHALADNELDAANAVAIEAHLRSCGDCRAELERIRAVRGILAAPALRDRASAGLHTRIDAMLEAEGAVAPAPRKPLRAGFAAHVLNGRWASGALAGALAASLALVVAMPQLTQPGIEDQLVQSHVRSLLVDHVVDVQTSDRHVVKPWFNGKIDFAPPVPELAASGFPLVGGRLDYIDDRAAAVIVYRRRLHTINLFVRPAAALSLPLAIAARHEGYSLLRWTAGGLEYWAVSDLDPKELALFRQDYVAQAVP
ncbi:MAG: anti-sigma factor [Sphingomonas sp.]